MKKVFIIAGTRPELIKLFPVHAELKKSKSFKVVWVSTGQHREMLAPVYRFFDFKPDIDFDVMVKNQSLNYLSTELLQKCDQLFSTEKPDCVVVQGDTTSAMCAALSSFHLRIPVAHVEAGLRSYNIFAPYPEEVNRKIISTVASLHFTPTPASQTVLKRENVNGLVLMTGNTVIDALQYSAKEVGKSERLGKFQKFGAYYKPYKKMILITGHRRENFGAGFRSICNAIRKLAEKFPETSFVYPVHLNPNVRTPVNEILSGINNIFLIDPVPYDEMVFLMKKCYLILTDSGGIQEEAPTLGKPVLVMRTITERPEGVRQGCAKLVGTSEQKIYRETNKLLSDRAAYTSMSKVINPYGDGKSARRISKALKQYLV